MATRRRSTTTMRGSSRSVELAGSLGYQTRCGCAAKLRALAGEPAQRRGYWREQRITPQFATSTTTLPGVRRGCSDRREATCTRCGVKLTTPHAARCCSGSALTTPEFLSMSTLLVRGAIGVHLRVWLAAGNGAFSLPSRS